MKLLAEEAFYFNEWAQKEIVAVEDRKDTCARIGDEEGGYYACGVEIGLVTGMSYVVAGQDLDELIDRFTRELNVNRKIWERKSDAKYCKVADGRADAYRKAIAKLKEMKAEFSQEERG